MLQKRKMTCYYCGQKVEINVAIPDDQHKIDRRGSLSHCPLCHNSYVSIFDIDGSIRILIKDDNDEMKIIKRLWWKEDW